VRSLSDIKQKDWLKACNKLGLEVNKKAGKGSHALVKSPVSGAKYTIQNHLYPIANIQIYKKLLEWGFSEEEIDNAL
jgi:predicted RNA binding protein YcfA (HicA-like mRNA interferase family)